MRQARTFEDVAPGGLALIEDSSGYLAVVVTAKVFLLSPANVTVAAEDKQRIVEGGFFNQS